MSHAVPELTPWERDRTTCLRQGDLLRAINLPFVTIPATSVHQEELHPETRMDLPVTVEVEIPSGLVAVVSADCDLVRPVDLEPTLIAAPVEEVPAALHRHAHDGAGSSRIFSLPQLPERLIGRQAMPHAAIDVRWLHTIEKTILLRDTVEVIPCPLDSARRDRLRLWLGRRLGRIGYPDDIQRHVVTPLVTAVTHPGRAESELERLRDAACWYGLRWAEGSSVVAALVVLDPALRARAGLDDGALRGARAAIRERLHGRTGPYTVTDLTIAGADQISLLDATSYRQFFLDPLDGDHGEYAQP